jgi:Ca2+-binding RTX toxin-like protein
MLRCIVARAGAIAPVLLVLAAALPASVSAAPSCAEGPRTEGEAVVGTPCADTIHVPLGVTTVYGEGGDDTIYGGRSNQRLYGGAGNDRLYGGIGDDMLRGGPGNDLLSGGFGADSLDGEGGSDYVRGDATIDYIGDSGADGTDTLSFATGATPGFPNAGNLGYEGFPEGADGRGVFIRLGEDFANDGVAPDGGGVDKPLPPAEDFESFETVIGTPFSDYIVGTSAKQTIHGGGGADVLLGEGGGDTLDGGAEGDYCGGGGTLVSCEFGGGEQKVEPRDPSSVAAGLTSGAGNSSPTPYLDGSNVADLASATFSEPSGEPRVAFKLQSGSAATFDASASDAGGCDPPGSSEVVCPLTEVPDSLVLAGLAGEDSFSAAGFPPTTSIVELGGEGADNLSGTDAEDVLVDGPGDDTVNAGSGDDALPNNLGQDSLSAGAGNDLFISDAVCEGDALDGGEGRDNANWAKFGSAVSLDLETGTAGLVGANGLPACGGSLSTSLQALEDLEGSNLDDTLIGDAGSNQLLGRPGADSYFAKAGDDLILANSGDSDVVIDCGEGFDTALIDIPTSQYADPAPIGCEAVYELPPNSFRPPDTPPGSGPGSAPSTTPGALTSPAAVADTRPPRTRILHRPRRLVFSRHRRRRVVFAFASSEIASRFRCKLDRGRFRPCRSPRRYRVRSGRHAFRVYAIDAAGNRDRSPALFRFRVRRRG